MTKRLKTRSWHQIPYSLFWALGISCRDNFSQLQLSWMTGVIPAYNLTSSSGSHGLHLTIQYTINTIIHYTQSPPLSSQPARLNRLMWRLFPGGARTTTWEHFHHVDDDDECPLRICYIRMRLLSPHISFFFNCLNEHSSPTPIIWCTLTINNLKSGNKHFEKFGKITQITSSLFKYECQESLIQCN